MNFEIFIVLMITMIQLAGAYLRYLAFETELEGGVRARLWQYLILWSLVSSAA